MNNSTATPSAAILHFPGVLLTPLVQRRRPGPLPKGIVSIRNVRQEKACAQYLADQRRASVGGLERRIREHTQSLELIDEARVSCLNRRAAMVAEVKAISMGR